MAYWQLFYHVVWATKNRLPLLTPDIESVVHGFLRSKAVGLEATVFALNGVEDHVHLVVAIPPKIAVAKFIGQIKAVASTRFNKSGRNEGPLFWQDEYGVFTAGRRACHTQTARRSIAVLPSSVPSMRLPYVQALSLIHGAQPRRAATSSPRVHRWPTCLPCTDRTAINRRATEQRPIHGTSVCASA